MTHPQRNERGSATVEAVLGVPVFVLLILLAIMGGRVALTKQAVNAAAADAARVASLSRDAEHARSGATDVARASLASQQITCLRTEVIIDTTGLRRPAGTPGQVSATVVCTVQLADLGLPATGSRTIASTISSPVDTWRERTGR